MKTIREIIKEYIPNEDISKEMIYRLYEREEAIIIMELENAISMLQERIKELKQ